jgi:hypothetical protein
MQKRLKLVQYVVTISAAGREREGVLGVNCGELKNTPFHGEKNRVVQSSRG